jgi:hypothetical protein
LVLPKMCREFRGDPDVWMSMYIQSPTSHPSPSPTRKKINQFCRQKTPQVFFNVRVADELGGKRQK